jgi:hypothetical protein
MSSGCRCVARPGAGGFGLCTCRTENLIRAHEANADTLRCAFRCSGSRQMVALLERPERLKAHVKWIAILLATCLTPVPLRPQDLSPITNAHANSQASNEMILGERLAREYEKQAGLGSTPELVEESARLFALVNFGIADATISFFEAKYIYHFWRPVTPAELTDSDWLPLSTKPHRILLIPLLIVPPAAQPQQCWLLFRRQIHSRCHIRGPAGRTTGTLAAFLLLNERLALVQFYQALGGGWQQ